LTAVHVERPLGVARTEICSTIRAPAGEENVAVGGGLERLEHAALDARRQPTRMLTGWNQYRVAPAVGFEPTTK
jgi:hypothetical protein